MKRSEMLKLIESVIDAGSHEYDKATRADNLLCHLEQAGMLPPRSKHTDPGHFPGDSFEYELNEWESED